MLNFAVGPVQSDEIVRSIGAEQIPYFRTPEFSQLMLENERLIKKYVGAEENARAVFLTGSGTASMEAAVINCFDNRDRVLVINGGSFGARFAELCRIHGIAHEQVHLDWFEPLTAEHLQRYAGRGFTGLLINVNETSTGTLYDMNLVGEFCRREGIFLVADAVSAFLCDPLDMKAIGADVLLTGSQKALSCDPGVSLLVLSAEAQRRIETIPQKCMYLDLRSALKDGERGQTPFTPAVGVLRQIHARLIDLESRGGAAAEIARVQAQAEDFRAQIQALPLEIASRSRSNAVTPLHPLSISAKEVFRILKDEYDIWICPNGGELADRIFRVGHMGALTPEDNTILIRAMEDMVDRGLM